MSNSQAYDEGWDDCKKYWEPKIDTLKIDNDRLRKALQEIVDRSQRFTPVRHIAKLALNGGDK